MNLLPRWARKALPARQSKAVSEESEDRDETMATAVLEVIDCSESSALPTIHLDVESGVPSRSRSTVRGSLKNVGGGDSGAVVATPVTNLDWSLDDSAHSYIPSPNTSPNKRAAYISVAAFECNGNGIGLRVSSIRGRLRISEIEKKSAFYGESSQRFF